MPPPTDAYNVAVIRYRAGLGNYLTVLTAQTRSSRRTASKPISRRVPSSWT